MGIYSFRGESLGKLLFALINLLLDIKRGMVGSGTFPHWNVVPTTPVKIDELVCVK